MDASGIALSASGARTSSTTPDTGVVTNRPRSTDADLARVGSLRFEDFFAEHRDRVGRALALTLSDEDLGFEAADEAMARALQRWDKLQNYANPQGWVYRTGLNWARSWMRRRKRGRDKAPLIARPAASCDRPIDPDLSDALAGLSDDHRAVIVLRFYWDLTIEQTAEVLGIAPGTVKSRLSRALDKLANHKSQIRHD